jgi:hypothetical protein
MNVLRVVSRLALAAGSLSVRPRGTRGSRPSSSEDWRGSGAAWAKPMAATSVRRAARDREAGSARGARARGGRRFRIFQMGARNATSGSSALKLRTGAPTRPTSPRRGGPPRAAALSFVAQRAGSCLMEQGLEGRARQTAGGERIEHPGKRFHHDGTPCRIARHAAVVQEQDVPGA